MSAHPPPVPPEQRPRHGKDPEKSQAATTSTKGSPDNNLAEQGQAGNTKQNTTNQGLQQDR